MEDVVIHLGIGRTCDEKEMPSEREDFQERSGQELQHKDRNFIL
jgi:hypothetical protein